MIRVRQLTNMQPLGGRATFSKSNGKGCMGMRAAFVHQITRPGVLSFSNMLHVGIDLAHKALALTSIM